MTVSCCQPAAAVCCAVRRAGAQQQQQAPRLSPQAVGSTARNARHVGDLPCLAPFSSWASGRVKQQRRGSRWPTAIRPGVWLAGSNGFAIAAEPSAQIARCDSASDMRAEGCGVHKGPLGRVEMAVKPSVLVRAPPGPSPACFLVALRYLRPR